MFVMKIKLKNKGLLNLYDIQEVLIVNVLRNTEVKDAFKELLKVSNNNKDLILHHLEKYKLECSVLSDYYNKSIFDDESEDVYGVGYAQMRKNVMWLKSLQSHMESEV